VGLRELRLRLCVATGVSRKYRVRKTAPRKTAPMTNLSIAAGRTLHDVGRSVDLRTYAWTCLKDFPVASDEAVKELETLGYLAKYKDGWKITATGIAHLLNHQDLDTDRPAT
jgi:hypothetical protein